MSKSADGAKKYYCEAYYKEGHSAQLDYYSEQDQLIGRWGGKASEKLGLTSDIARRDFAMLCENINPSTKRKLTRRNDENRTVGYDFTFNASKSVSLAYTFADEEEKKAILKAFQQSVRDTMADVEAGMQTRVRSKGQNENRLTSNIAYGEFTHFTTRPVEGIPDPHLHSHCFVFNATYDNQEKKWKAGQFQQLKQDAPYYEAVFHSRLATNLQGLGYAIKRTKNSFELTGVEKQTIEEFSRRTKEIEHYATEHNITDAKEKSEIGAKTREAKRADVTPEEQEADWLNRLTPSELTTLRNLKNYTSDADAGSKSNPALSALQFSLGHHLERKSVVSDKEILATAIKSSVGDTTPEQVRGEFDKDTNILLAQENLRTFITTKEALQEEKQLIANTSGARNIFRPLNENYQPQNRELNEQQRTAVAHALSSTDGITIITGKAGTGKTSLMKEVQKGITESGKAIYAFAPSSEASRGVQRSEGFKNADTVAKLLQDKNLQAELNSQVIWIDEAGMLSNRDMNKVFDIAKAQSARIILSGDTKQHGSVQRGDALRIVEQHGGIKPVTVSKIVRQKNEAYKDAVQMLSMGGVEKGFKKLEKIGAIQEIADSKERINAIADEYYQSAFKGRNEQKEVLVIAPTHAEGELVTGSIRSKLKDKNVLGDDDRAFKILKNLQFTEAEKQNPESYTSGQVILFHKNMTGIKEGSRLEIVSVKGNDLLAKDSKGSSYNIPLEVADKYSVHEVKEIGITKGDKLRITGNGKATDGKHLFNGTTYHVEGFDRQGHIKLSNGSVIPKDYGQFNLGYVTTSHSSQGKTADKVIISQSSSTFRASSMEQFYVSVSRGKQAVSIYTDDKESLKHAVSQSSQRTSATELTAMRQAQATEINRVSLFRKGQQKAAETYYHLQSKIRNHGLQTTTRTR